MKKKTKFDKKMGKVMSEFGKGQLHSGKSGKVVTSRKQAVAIALSQARKARGDSKKEIADAVSRKFGEY